MAEAGMDRVSPKTVGEILVEREIVTQEQLDEALVYAKSQGKRLGEVLVERGVISWDHIYWALGQQYGVHQVEVSPDMIDRELVFKFPLKTLRQHCLLPLIQNGDELVVLTGDPLNTRGVDELKRVFPNIEISLQLASLPQIELTLEELTREWEAVHKASAIPGIDAMGELDRPEQLVSREGIEWMLHRAARASGDLVITRKGKGTVQAVVVSATVEDVVIEFDASAYNGLLSIINTISAETAPAFPGAMMWPGHFESEGRFYGVAITLLRSFGASGIRMRPLRVTVPGATMIEEFELSAEDERTILTAADASAGRLALIVAEEPVEWSPVLYHYVRRLSQSTASVLFLSAISRFAIPTVYQYAGEWTLSSRQLLTLASQTSAGHVVIDTPATHEDYLALRSTYPVRPGLSILYQVAAGGKIPAAFWELLKAEPRAVVLRVSATGVEQLSAARAETILAEMR